MIVKSKVSMLSKQLIIRKDILRLEWEYHKQKGGKRGFPRKGMKWQNSEGVFGMNSCEKSYFHSRVEFKEVAGDSTRATVKKLCT